MSTSLNPALFPFSMAFTGFILSALPFRIQLALCAEVEVKKVSKLEQFQAYFTLKSIKLFAFCKIPSAFILIKNKE